MTKQCSSSPASDEAIPRPTIDSRRRLLLKAGAGAITTLSSGILAACGGDDDGAPVAGGDPPPAANPPVGAHPPVGARPPVGGTAQRSVFTTSGHGILLNNQTFFGKGFCYSPSPIGADFAFQPWGDFFTPFWKETYRRDIPRMQAMGVNTIRLYTTSPFIEPWNPASGAQDHTDFLDLCHQNGIYVWAAHPIESGAFRGSDAGKAAIAQGVRNLCESMKDHPAVIGFTIGNELNNGTDRADPAWWNWLNDLAALAKSIAPDKLTMACFVDDSMETVRLAQSAGGGASNLDVFGINSYRGTQSTGFDNLFSSFDSITTRPLMITEFGCPASGRNGNAVVELPNNAKAQADYLVAHWRDIENNRNVCAGGYVFSWSDEWWKHGKPAQHDGGDANTRNPAFPGGWGDEEWFGIHSVAVGNNRNPATPVVNGRNVPDVLTSRAAYAALKALWTA